MESKKIFGIPITFLVIGMMIIGGATATLVGYLSNTISADVTVDSPILLNDGNSDFTVDIDNGGEYDMALIKVENKADVPVYGNLKIIFSDVTGWHTAVSEDITYCFNGQGDTTNVDNCADDYKQWVKDNPEWMDWVADSDYNSSVYEANYVINHGENSFTNLGYDDNSLVMPITEENAIPAGEIIYGVVYFDTELGLDVEENFDIDIKITI